MSAILRCVVCLVWIVNACPLALKTGLNHLHDTAKGCTKTGTNCKPAGSNKIVVLSETGLKISAFGIDDKGNVFFFDYIGGRIMQLTKQ